MRDTASDAASQRYSDSVLNAYINLVQGEVNADTWAVEASTSYVLTAQTTYYALPSTFLGMKRANFTDHNGATFELQEYSEKTVIDTMADYERSSIGQPTKYFTRQSKSGGTAMQIAYLPVPTTTSTGTVRLDMVIQPTDLSSDSDVPFNGLLWLAPYHDVIVYGVTVRLKLIEARTDEAQDYQQLYQAEEQSMKGGSQMMPNFRPSAQAGSGGSGR